jgi:DNA-damage-inducible protein J
MKDAVMAGNALVQTRIDGAVKNEAAAVLATMGLTVSEAVRLMLIKVAREKVLPFDAWKPNAETIAAMREANEISRTRRARFATAEALFDDLEKNSKQ